MIEIKKCTQNDMGFRRHRTTGMGEKMAHTPKFFEVCAIEGYSSRSKLFLDRLLPSRACLCFILTMKCKQPSLFSPRKFSTVFRLLEGSLSSYFMRGHAIYFHYFLLYKASLISKRQLNKFFLKNIDYLPFSKRGFVKLYRY